MKKILITGADSYIGTAFEQYIQRRGEAYRVETVDTIGDAWQKTDFAAYDAVLHVAGIVHVRETDESRDLYYCVNRDLTVQIAERAKEAGVKQFIFISSMSVYGLESGVITPETQPQPITHYGKSKLEAEQGLESLQDERFRVAVLRLPMVYGKGCKGNFQLLLRLVQKSPVFPAVHNRRSMISVENLCSFLQMIVDSGACGVFFPQNREYVDTVEMAKTIAKVLGKRVFFSRLAGLAVRLLIPVLRPARKAFSTLIYQDCEQHDFCYCETDFESSVRSSI